MTSANTWPGGRRHAMDQGAHKRWNARNYPGTRQMCALCDEPTGRCEEDEILLRYGPHAGEPICPECRKKRADSVLSIDTAPRDGTVVVGIDDDGEESLVRWQEERYCMLGSRAGSYPPGWAAADEDVDNNLPVDAPVAWLPVKEGAER